MTYTKPEGLIVIESTIRGLTPETLSRYGCAITAEGDLYMPYYSITGEVIGAKVRKKGTKSFRFEGNSDEVTVFGVQTANGDRHIIVTEGELDAMSASQMTGYPAVSVPHGADSAVKHCKKCLKFLESFDTIYVVMDADEPGQKAQSKLMELFKPGKARAVTLPMGRKDPNDMLVANQGQLFKSQLFAGRFFLPVGITTKEDLVQRAVDLYKNTDARVGTPTGYEGLDRLIGGWRQGELHTIAAGTGIGKAVKLDTLVIMCDGSVKQHGDLIEGDVLANGVVVEAVSDVWKDRPIIRVTFDDGTYYDCDENHLWAVSAQKRRDANNVVLSTKDMLNDYLYPNSSRKRYAVDLVVTEYPSKPQPIDPYLLGVWLGDGSYNTGEVTLHDDDAHILNGFGFHKTNTKYKWSCLGLSVKLRELGVSGQGMGAHNMKYIPNDYLYGDYKQRLCLLQGLLDSDGTVESGVAVFYNTSQSLAVGVLQLARSLGLKAKLKTKRAILYGKDCGTCYRVYIRCASPVKLFCLERKQALLRVQQASASRKFISKMERIGTADTNCIQVSGGLYQLIGHTTTHNSALSRNLVYRFADRGKALYIPLEDVVEISSLLFAEMRLGASLVRQNSVDEETLTATLSDVLENILIYDQRGSVGVEELIDAIGYVVREHDVSFVVLDHITAMADGLEMDERKALDACIKKLKFDIASALGVTVVVVSHLSRDTSDKEDNVPVLSRLKGASSIAQYSDTVFGVSRKRDSTLMTIKTLKGNRVWGQWGEFTLELSNELHQLVETTPQLDEANDYEFDNDKVSVEVRGDNRPVEPDLGVRNQETTVHSATIEPPIQAGLDNTNGVDSGEQGVTDVRRQTKTKARKTTASRTGVRTPLPA